MSAVVGKTARTVATLVRFLARVRPHVCFQVAGGSECLLANPESYILYMKYYVKIYHGYLLALVVLFLAVHLRVCI